MTELIRVKDIKYGPIKLQKPILKWVGGKTKILDKLICDFPCNINNYHEIFLGGGSVLFALLSFFKEGIIKINGNIYAYDLNEPLIYMYKNIQSNCEELYNTLQALINDYNEIDGTNINRKPESLIEAKQSKENYYYWIRQQYNFISNDDKTSVYGSAMFIFLNKTCFRGLFRVGPNGFNVPYGNYINPEIINKEHLEEISELIQCVKFECYDYTVSLNKIVEDDYIYMDPPYAPETNTSFVKYTDKGFNLNNHIELFKICNKLSNEKKKFMMSNADVDLIKEYFKSDKYNIDYILCKRTINSKNPEATAKEVIIKNY